MAPESWSLRVKDDAGVSSTVAIPGFVSGCVIDLDTVKIGWEKDGGKGIAPQRIWAATTSKRGDRPSQETKLQGGLAWSEAFACRCAAKDQGGNAFAATWSQASFGANEAFMGVMKQAADQWKTHSQNDALLPLIRQTSIERRTTKNGSSSIPILVIERWVARPAVLSGKTAPFAIATAPVAPAAAPPVAATVSATADF